MYFSPLFAGERVSPPRAVCVLGGGRRRSCTLFLQAATSIASCLHNVCSKRDCWFLVRCSRRVFMSLLQGGNVSSSISVVAAFESPRVLIGPPCVCVFPLDARVRSARVPAAHLQRIHSVPGHHTPLDFAKSMFTPSNSRRGHDDRSPPEKGGGGISLYEGAH